MVVYMIALETCKEIKKVPIEFYLLNDDYTWNTIIFDVPQPLVTNYHQFNWANQLIDWVYMNKNISKNVCIVGIYSTNPNCKMTWD